MYIVVLFAMYSCSACCLLLFCLRNVVVQPSIFHRTPNAIRTDSVRRPIRLRPPSDDFRLGFARRKYGFLCAKTVPVGAFGGFSVVGNRLVGRNVMQEVVRALVVVDAAAVVLQSVAHYEVVYV